MGLGIFRGQTGDFLKYAQGLLHPPAIEMSHRLRAQEQSQIVPRRRAIRLQFKCSP